MAKKVIRVHSAELMQVEPSKCSDHIYEYFYSKKAYVEAFMRIIDEMVACFPETKVIFTKGTLCLGILNGHNKDDITAFVYVSSSLDGYTISFSGSRQQKFNPKNIEKYIEYCEKSVLTQDKNQKKNTKRKKKIEIKDYLDSSQRKFYQLPAEKNIRLLAPAGSGKTYSMLWRCKSIVDQYQMSGNGKPRFLLVTFTRSACAEIESRLGSELFSDIEANVKTLNAWGWEQIRKTGKEQVTKKYDRQNLVLHDLLSICQNNELINQAINYPKRKRKHAELIIDLLDLYKAMSFSHNMKKADYNAHIKYLKEIGLEKQFREQLKEFFCSAGINIADKKELDKAEADFFDFWKKAVVQLEANNRYTLEDQKYWAKQYIDEKIDKKDFPKGITKYTHVMIDEFQDINPLDMSLVNSIIRFHGAGNPISLSVVGDDDQAIFGWRGTTPKYILNPEKYFDLSFETCILENNYRSPNAIVNYSKNLIECNKKREIKKMKSLAKGRATVKVVKQSRKSSIETTVKLVHELLDNGCKQIALIGRRQASLFPYQILFSSEKLQYNVEADIDILNGESMMALQDIVKTVYRYKMDDNDNPIEEILTIFDKVNRYDLNNAKRKELELYLNSCDIETCDDVLSEAIKCTEIFSNIDTMCEVARKILDSNTVYELMTAVEEDLDGLSMDYTKTEVDNHYKDPQFYRLADLSLQYGTDFRKFYKDIDRARRQSEVCRNANNNGTGNEYLKNQEIPIHLVTATRSKGHQFEAVIILDANDTEWPSNRAIDIEEERRLFYVAITRAQKYLYFIPDYRTEISRFINEMGL